MWDGELVLSFKDASAVEDAARLIASLGFMDSKEARQAIGQKTAGMFKQRLKNSLREG